MANPITAPTDGINVREVDPISRIEGHLGVKVATSGGFVTEADAHGNLWRGFENFLLGRDINDAITFTQRICGVCPVPHGMTSTYAVDSVLGYSENHITFADTAYTNGMGVPAKAVLIRNLVLSAEFLMSSITHFYHLAAPSYVQGPAIPPWTPYFDSSYYHAALLSNGRVAPENAEGFSSNTWSTVIRSYVTALRVRRLTFEAGALFAGRMPMTSTLIGGGVMFDGTENLSARCATFNTLIEEVGRFIVKEYVPIALVLGALYLPFDNTGNGGNGYGGGLGNFLAWGAFPSADATGTLALPGGCKSIGTPALNFQALNKAGVASTFLAGPNSVPNNLTESIAHSRYNKYSGDLAAYTADGGNAAYPGAISRTEPNRANGYSYMKAPRWAGQPMEVGPLARLAVAGYYPVEGAFLRDVVPGYTTYVKTAGATTGLDPAMIAADVAVGVLRDGLATLTIDDGVNPPTVISSTAGLTNAQIVAAYTDANAVITGTVTGWVYGLKGGLSMMDRLRARALESLVLVQAMIGAYDKATDTFGTGWIDELAAATGPTYTYKAVKTVSDSGWGATEAPRGALMHQCTIVSGKITKYQCIVPTTWNGSPKDAAGNRGAIEAACVGVPYSAAGASFTNQAGGSTTTQGGVEVLRAAQSFDPCIACAVH